MQDATQSILIVLGSLLGAAITAWVTWKIAKRRSSGSVNTSEAASLWKESAAMRSNLTDQVVGLRQQLASTSDQLTSSSSQVSSLLREIAISNAATAAAREETRLSREESAQLRALLTSVHEEVKTSNSLSLAALADNTESRRIQEIPPGERTPGENTHLESVGIQQYGSESDDPAEPEASP